jgi:hypothetical protein
MAADALIDELLARGADDWVTAAEVAWIARSVGDASTDGDVLEVSVDVIRAVLTDGLMDAGDVTDGGFFEWGLSPAESVRRIEQAWLLLGRLPNLGEVCWLSNTTAGQARAERVMAHRDRDQRSR